MKTIDMKNFGGLTYITVVNIPLRESEFGDVIDMKPRELEILVARAIIENNIPSKMTKSKLKFTNPWENIKIDKLCKKKKAFNEAKMIGKQEHKDKYKQIKATAQREIRRAQK